MEMDFWDSCTEIVWERRPFPPCALGAFEFLLFSCLVLIEFRFSFIDSWPRDDEVFLEDWVTLWSGSNPSSLVPKPPGSRVYSNWRFCVIEKTPFLLGNSSIPPKPWSDSSISSVDMFTSPLWSCLQKLVRFGLDLALRSSSYSRTAGWKIRFWARAEKL